MYSATRSPEVLVHKVMQDAYHQQYVAKGYETCFSLPRTTQNVEKSCSIAIQFQGFFKDLVWARTFLKGLEA